MDIKADLSVIGAKNPILQSCSEQTRFELGRRGKLQMFEGGAILFREGDSTGVALFLLDGKLQMDKTAQRGRRQVFCNLDCTMCGGACLLLISDRSLADVRALEPGAVLVLPRRDLQELARIDPTLCQAAWAAVGECLMHFAGLVESLSFQKVAQRVAGLLLDATTPNNALVRRTQAELAAEVGTTREVVARCLADFQRSGAIRLGRGRITVLDHSRLRSAWLRQTLSQ